MGMTKRKFVIPFASVVVKGCICGEGVILMPYAPSSRSSKAML